MTKKRVTVEFVAEYDSENFDESAFTDENLAALAVDTAAEHPDFMAAEVETVEE